MSKWLCCSHTLGVPKEMTVARELCSEDEHVGITVGVDLFRNGCACEFVSSLLYVGLGLEYFE
jgi:hypothetical protein